MDFRPTGNSHIEPRASRPARRVAALRLLLGLVAGLAFLAAALSVPISLAADPDVPASDAAQPPVAQAAPVENHSQPQSVAAVLQGVVNGSFEDGNLGGWTTGGAANRSEVLVEDDFTTSAGDAARPQPTDGNFFALLCTGPGSINGVTVGNVDGDGGPTPDFDTSIITKTFTLLANEVPTTLSFDWSFLTAEGQRAPDAFDDFFEVRLNGSVILAGSRPAGGVSPYQDVTPIDSISYEVTGGTAGETQGCNFVTGRSPFQTFRRIITNPGVYNLQFLVADQGDSNIDTGLLLDNVDLQPEIDLELTKTADPDPATAGEPLFYDLTVRNLGSGRARNVVVTDTLPAEVEFITHTLPSFVTDTLPSGCTFSAGTGADGRDQLFCDLGDMLGGVERNFRIKVDVDSNAMNTVDALTNDVVVDSLTADGNLDNNVVQLITPLTDLADLRVVKMSKPDNSVRAGELFTYTIFVDNLGPSHSRNVVLTDTILTSGDLVLVGFEEDPDRPDSCGLTATPDGSLIVCELGQSLEPQGDPPRNGRWVIKVRVRANEAQDINNEVIVFSRDPDGSAGPELATPDPDTSNNRALDFISVTAVADLGMTKIGVDAGSDPDTNPFTVLAGESVQWTINIENNGPSTAENVQLIDVLPAGLVEGSVSVVAVTPPVGGGQCTVGTPGDPTEPLICQLGNIEPGGTAIVTIIADIDPNYLIDQPNTAFADFLPNDAFLVSDTLDPDTDDNIVFDALVRVLASADVVVQKVDRPDPVIAGEQLEYTLTISNAGPSSAEDVVLLDEFSDTLTAIEVNIVNERGAACTIRTTPANIIDCGLGHIQPGKTISIVITSLVRANTPSGAINNTVSATSVTPDPNGANNIGIAQPTDVETRADVEITKVGEPVKVNAGEQVKYTIWVENNGPSDAQDVLVSDLLPDEVVYEIDTNSPMCTRPANTVGLRAPLTAAGVGTQAVGLSTFVMEVTATGAELTYAIEVSDIDNVTGAELTDGVITIPLYAGPPPALDPPNPFVATIQLTAAQRDAILADPSTFDVIVRTSDFPAGEIRGTVDDAVETMTGEDNIPLRCEVGALPTGASHHFDIWALVDPATPAGTVITNVAIVTSTTSLGDPNVGNNVGSFRNYVEGEADLHVRKFGKPDGEVRANQILTYTVVVDNLGPSSAEGVALKDILQSAGSFDLVDISTDRETFCVGIPAPSPGVTVPATAWPPGQLPIGVDPVTGEENISERLELDCTLTEPLDVLDADGPPNSGRWLLTVRVRGLDQSQNMNNVASVLSEVTDPNLDNNNAFVVHDITDVANLEINKTELGEVQVNGQPGGTVDLLPSQVTAGRGLTYTIVVTNNGPSTAENVVLNDRLPPGIVVTGFTATQGDCDTGAPGEPLDKLTCGLGTMTPGDTITVEVQADVDPSLPDGTILENDVFVFSDRFDDDNTNNYATNLTQVTTAADLAVTKDDFPDPVLAGRQLEYTLIVTNTGPSVARDVIVSDVLPPELTAIRVDVLDALEDGDVGNKVTPPCTIRTTPPTAVYCALGDMDPGEIARILVTAFVNPSVPDSTTINNTVVVRSEHTPDPLLTNNQDAEATLILTQADMAIQKMSKPDKVFAGEQKKYTIWVENLGPSDALSVTVTDTLPAEVAYEIDTDKCAVTGIAPNGAQILTCTNGTMAPGATWHFDIWALVDPATPPGTIITNTAVVTGNTTLGDPNLDNNTATTKNLVLQKADLKITKFGKPDGKVRAGNILTYTVIVDNLGPSYAGIDARDPVTGNVAVKDVLQSDLEYDLLTITSDRGMVCSSLPGDGDPTDGVAGVVQHLEIDCTLNDALEVLAADGPPNPGRWIITMTVTADQTQDINNVAHATSDAFDPYQPNNQAFVMHEITDVADLEIVKDAVGEVQVDGQPGGTVTLMDDLVTAGQALTYTITITNHGPSIAENIVLEDRLPPGIVVTGFTSSQGDCDTGTPGQPLDKLTCGFGTLVADASATITITADVDPSLPNGTILENDVLTFSDIFDPTNANNFDTNLTTVNTRADLAVTKSDNPDPVVAGELLEYTVTVTNTGPSDALNVIVQDVLPEKVEFLRIRDPFNIGVICSLNAIDERTLTCAVGDIPVGEHRTFVILVEVEQDAPPVLLNDVSVSSDTQDPFLDNNTDQEDTGVIREEGLFIFKSDTPDPVLAGTELRYLVNFGNNGPSRAENVRVTDTLPLGLTFNRCESLDPNNRVTCAVDSGDGNTTPQIVRVVEIREVNTPVYTDTGVIDVGDSFTFRLIADVESGFVLNGRSDAGPGEICRPLFLASGYPYFAHNRIDIASNIDSAFDDECTRVNAEADLVIDKADDAGFLQGDPVVPGDTLTYTLTISNTGPSDTAQVFVVDWLPPEGLILDPTMVDVTVSAGQVVEIRDDGRITVLVGNDPNNNGVNQVGRLNAGNVETVQIVVRVALDAACGSTLTNFAYVETRRNDAVWPPILGADFAPTPTEDPDPTNNTAEEDTSVVCPEITIDKTVSLDGTCPGTNNVAIGFIGQPITYCYEITNTGDTYLDFIRIVDTVQTRSGPFVIFDQTFRGNPEGDPGLPLAPGDSFVVTNTEPDLDILIDCNDRPDTATVTATVVNRGRTCRLPGAGPAADGTNALAPDGFAQEPECRVVSDDDDAYVQTPCKGVDWRLQLPILNTNECDTWIQIQNVGNEVTKALMVLWGAAGACPPQSFGPIKVECTGLLRPGSAWSFTNPYLPPGANSAIVYSLNATNVVQDERGNEVTFADLACLRLFPLVRGDHTEWLLFDRAYTERGTYFGPIGDTPTEQLMLDFGANQGEPLAVTVNRTCPDPLDPNVYSSAAYVGVSTDREGIRDPRAGGFAYYAPLVWASISGMNSLIHIQNSGLECTSIELWFQQQGECLRPLVWDILGLAPGETISFDPNIVVGPMWQGSVWASASQPLGIIVDTLGANHFGSYHAVPADVYVDGGRGDFSLGTLVNYAPLIYREHQGWETAIQVQNLSSVYNAKVKVYFLDNSGGIIKTVVDWICPRGSQTFFLPVIAGLPGNWVGAARIESENWITPGDPAVDAPRILSVVLLEKYTDPAKTARQEAVIYNALQEMGSFDWQVGPGPRNGFGGSDVLSVPLIAQANRGVTSELAIQNLNPNPGFTDFVIFIYDQNRLIDFVCEKLNEKQVEYIDLYDWNLIPQGFLGSIVISSTYTNQPGGAALGAVAVERVGSVLAGPDIPGDESKAFEAFPLYNRFLVEVGPDGGPPECP